MVKLTAEMIQDCAQYTNALKDREIDLRGYKISVIENLGATLDQFESMDMSDNDIRKLEGFPLLRRLRTLLLNNNRVCRIQEHLEESLPYLESVILTNNNIQDLQEIDPLSTVKTLRYVSFLRNPVASRPNYRLYVISKLPQIRVLDFQRIRDKERKAAARMFKTEKTEAKKTPAKRAKTFEPKEPVLTTAQKEANSKREMDVKAIKAAIANASSLEEVKRLELMLQRGQIPGRKEENNGAISAATGKGQNMEEVEEMDEG